MDGEKEQGGKRQKAEEEKKTIPKTGEKKAYLPKKIKKKILSKRQGMDGSPWRSGISHHPSHQYRLCWPTSQFGGDFFRVLSIPTRGISLPFGQQSGRCGEDTCGEDGRKAEEKAYLPKKQKKRRKRLRRQKKYKTEKQKKRGSCLGQRMKDIKKMAEKAEGHRKEKNKKRRKRLRCQKK